MIRVVTTHREHELYEDLEATLRSSSRVFAEYLLEDSDLDGLSDITVSSVHTSDLSSLEEQSEDDELLSDSSEEGELQSDGRCRTTVSTICSQTESSNEEYSSPGKHLLFLRQIKTREQKREKPAATQRKKSGNLGARRTCTSPSSTPVTIATRMMRSPWKSVGEVR